MSETSRSGWSLDRLGTLDERRTVFVLFAVALAVRVAFSMLYGLSAPPLDWGDDDAYDRIARSIAFSGTYDDLWFPPGYPLFLAAFYKTIGARMAVIRIAQGVLGALTCVLVYRLGKRAFDARVGWLAAFGLALLPGHAYMAWRLMAETIYILLITGALLLAMRFFSAPLLRGGLWLGGVLGVANAFKSNLVIFPPALIAACSPQLLTRRPVPWAALITLVGAFFVANASTPIGNMIASGGQMAMLPANAGHTLWFSNNPEADGYFIDPRREAAAIAFIEAHGQTEALATDDALTRDRIYRDLALAWIRENPRAFLVLCGQKLANAYGPLPRAEVFEGNRSAKIVHVLTFASVIPLAAIGMLLARRRWRELAVLYVLVACHVLMVLIFYGTPRFTVIIMPALLVFASVPLLEIAARLRFATPSQIYPQTDRQGVRGIAAHDSVSR